MPDPTPAPKPAPRKIASPTGTRDFYPQDMLLRRYITDAWRRTALRHGFDEIDGPTFETAELYKVKSGEGILGEMFGVYSGKSPDDVESVKRGEPPYGLRPEFTPTLARMYAARAKQLPQPTKWFCVSNFFRAERPQRGRLREFFQWNCDVIGGEDRTRELVGRTRENDAESIATLVDCLRHVGLRSADAQVHIFDRANIIFDLTVGRVPHDLHSRVLGVLDSHKKLDVRLFRQQLQDIGLHERLIEKYSESLYGLGKTIAFVPPTGKPPFSLDGMGEDGPDSWMDLTGAQLLDFQVGEWCVYDPRIVRGLAYYTGTVFEVIAEGERAVAGGGRYDNLIELFGGPPTPACGFGMGDVVLANLLADRGLIPEGRDLLAALSQPMPVQPDAFVIASPNEHCDAAIVPLVARLRRGVETDRYAQGELKPWAVERYAVPPMHARRSYKATKNVGKLLADANGCHARFAVIIERYEPSSGQTLEGHATLKDLDEQKQHENVPLAEVGARIAAAMNRA